jgi:hypothetical protein
MSKNGRLGTNQAVCTHMFGKLPAEKQHRVIFWLRKGGEDGSYNPKAFLEHMDEKFLDHEAETKA